MKPCVIYTSLTGGYDPLLQPAVTDPDFDYVCFSDDFRQERVGVWEIRPIPFRHPDALVRSRYAKLQPHKVLPEYACSLWMDANIRITAPAFYDQVRLQMKRDTLSAHVNHVHENRDCVYDEIETCLRYGKIGLRDALRQYARLRKAHYPRHQGLFENNLLFRRHNEPFIRDLDDRWWAEFLQYAHRDQFSLNFLCWRAGYVPALLLPADKCVRNVPYLEYVLHPKETAAPGLADKVQIKLVRPAASAVYKLVTGIQEGSWK